MNIPAIRSYTRMTRQALGVSRCRWRNMRYRTPHGKLRLAAYQRNAFWASKAHKNRHRPYVFQPTPVPPALARLLSSQPISFGISVVRNLTCPLNLNYAPIQPTPTSKTAERALKALKLRIRQLEIEQHCAQMRAIHTANAAARRLQK